MYCNNVIYNPSYSCSSILKWYVYYLFLVVEKSVLVFFFERTGTLSREAKRLVSVFHLSFFSSKYNPPVSSPDLEQNTCYRLTPDPSAPVSSSSQEYSLPNLLPRIHCFIQAPSSSRHSLGTNRILLGREADSLIAGLYLSFLSNPIA